MVGEAWFFVEGGVFFGVYYVGDGVGFVGSAGGLPH